MSYPYKHLVLVTMLFSVGATFAQEAPEDSERILRYHSDITVFEDSWMEVKETIEVRVRGQKIKRGIYRDFPTTYSGPLGIPITVPFEIVSIHRNGKSEPYHTENMINGVRIKIGHEAHIISKKDHTYTITYRTRQLGYFRDHDELYWNVTGNGWDFPIGSASATVRLPAGIVNHDVGLEGYTGPRGSREQDLTASFNPEGMIHFKANMPLKSREGLTIVVTFPKGFVKKPGFFETLSMNIPTAVATIGSLLVGLYYLLAWIAVGRDPQKGLIAVTDSPPHGITPAAARYILNMGYDHRCFVAALVNMAIKGHVRIHASLNEYSIKRLDGPTEKLSRGEEKIKRTLLTSAKFTFRQSQHDKIGKAIKGLKTALSAEYEKVFFFTNRILLGAGILLGLTVLGTTIVTGAHQEYDVVGFLSLWLSIWTLGCFVLLLAVISAWRNRSKRLSITLFALPFWIAEIAVLCILASKTTFALIPALAIIFALVFFFHKLLKRPTLAGRRIMDEIEGFRDYLAEKDEQRRDSMAVETEASAVFERWLPYAIALGVEKQWAGQFESAIATASQAESRQHPYWYHGDDWTHIGDQNFLDGIGSGFASAISSSSSAPGSSSGSGGGGSSGGGGGGGGGGGW